MKFIHLCAFAIAQSISANHLLADCWAANTTDLFTSTELHGNRIYTSFN